MSASDRHAWTEPAVEEVAPGIYRIPLPLPYDALRAVNVYLLLGGDGPILVDSGWWLEAGIDRLRAAFAELDLEIDDLQRIIATHLHRDHYTLGVHLREVTGCDLSIGAGEQASLTALLAGESVVSNWIPILARAGAPNFEEGWNDDAVDRSKPIYGLPSTWLREGDRVSAATYHLDVLETPGHTRGHVSFAEAEASLFFAGDHVLPHITPSIGFETRPAELPLADYLNSLRKVKALPDLTLLPAHGPAGGSTHARVDELLTHHEVRLNQCLDAVAAGAQSAYDVARRIGWTHHLHALDDLSPMNQVMAIYETLAHVDVLVAQQRLRVTDDGGINRYSPS